MSVLSHLSEGVNHTVSIVSFESLSEGVNHTVSIVSFGCFF